MMRLNLAAMWALASVAADPASARQAQGAMGHAFGGYKISGAAAIRPSAIWDDGQKTFLDWPENIEAPAIFAIDAAGNESLVNSYYRDGRFVIDAVYVRLLFRLDQLTARADRRSGRS